jgi:hypothetical protein
MSALRRIAALTAVVAAVAAVPASADSTSAAAGVVTATGTSHGVVTNGKLTMAIDCEAAGAGAFAAISIVSCYTTNGVNAPSRALPGNASATAAEGNGALAPYSLCVRAIGTDINGVTHDTGLQCRNDLAGSGTGAVLATS